VPANDRDEPPLPRDDGHTRPTEEEAATEALIAERRLGLIRRLIGHKVSVSTTDLHHVVGRLVRLQSDGHGPGNVDGNDDSLVILVNNEEVHVRRAGVARIHEADPAIAEYLK
jgi:hypothetical protein